MGCGHSSPNFSSANTQAEMVEFLKNELTFYQNELTSLTNSINSKLAEAKDENTKSDINKSEDASRRDFLTKFVEVLTNTESILSTNTFAQFKTLAEVLNTFFQNANNKDASKFQEIRKPIKEWFDSNKPSSSVANASSAAKTNTDPNVPVPNAK